MAGADTENKRRSATGIQTIRTVGPVPDGTLTVLDWVQAAYIYAGIDPSGAVVLYPLYNFTAFVKDFNFNAEKKAFNFNARTRAFDFPATPGA
jgi:hypothetical protein